MLRKGVGEFSISGSAMEEKKTLTTNPAPKSPLLPHGGGAMVLWAGTEVISVLG